ncbi:MAG: ABC transporter permease [Bryobacteraceae bacterium]|nr:ABC transporter permease [Bryobacteraceae bacterium]
MRQDLSLALRQIRHNPGFALLAISALALGLGVNAAIFSVVYTVVLKPLPYPEAHRLVSLAEKRISVPSGRVIAPANYIDWTRRQTTFERMTPIDFITTNLTGVGDAEVLRGERVGADFFPMFGAAPAIGRGFTAADNRVGAPPVAVISDGLWRRKFSADPAIVGRVIRLGGAATIVIGVAPPHFVSISTRQPDFWGNIQLREFDNDGRRNGGRYLMGFAQLKNGVTVQAADAEMRRIGDELRRLYPENNADRTSMARSLDDELHGNVRGAIWILLGAVGCVLLIACANVASLMLTRVAARQRELTIRASLGATRIRLARQLLVESLTLAAAGTAVGLALAVWIVDAVRLWGPKDIPRLDTVSLEWPVLAAMAVVAAFTGLLLGIAPALSASRLASQTRGATHDAHATRVRDILSIAEVAIAVTVVCGAGLLVNSFVRLANTKPGFETRNILTMELSLFRADYPDEQRAVRFYEELTGKIRTLPGVEASSFITFMPMRGTGSATRFWRTDRPKPDPGAMPIADVRIVQRNYFDTLRIPLTRGRMLTDADMRPDAPRAYIVSEALAREIFPNEDPLGKSLIVRMDDEKPGEIVGVVADIRHQNLEKVERPTVYYPHAQLPMRWGSLVIRTAVPPETLAEPVRTLIREMDPNLPIAELATMEHWVDQTLARPRFQTMMLAAFGALALALAVLGIYGVMSYAVAQRTREIGIRMALGARLGDVYRIVLSRGFALTAIGLAIGLVGAWTLSRTLETMLYEVRPHDPATFVAVTLGVLAVALAACLIPARRASHVDPAVALRAES